MKKNNTLLFTKILYSLVIIGTIILVIIIYNNVENNIAIKFVIGYVVLLFFWLVYALIIAFFNVRKLKWDYIKKILKEFVFSFVILFVLKCMFDYIFKSSNMDILDACLDALSISFGVALIDVVFLKKGIELQ